MAFGSSLDTGLLAYYSLDVDATDDTGNGHDGSLTGTTLDGSGLISSCRSFSRSSGDYININSATSFNVLYQWTISMWVYHIGSSWPQYEELLVDSFDYLSYPCELENGQPGMYVIGLYHTTPLNHNQWHHLVFSYDDTAGTAYVVIDGDWAGRASIPFGAIWGEMVPESLSDWDGFAPFNGKQDEVGIWSRSLVQSEVEALYNSGAGLAYIASSGTSEQSQIGHQFLVNHATKINILGNQFYVSAPIDNDVILGHQFTGVISVEDISTFSHMFYQGDYPPSSNIAFWGSMPYLVPSSGFLWGSMPILGSGILDEIDANSLIGHNFNVSSAIQNQILGHEFAVTFPIITVSQLGHELTVTVPTPRISVLGHQVNVLAPVTSNINHEFIVRIHNTDLLGHNFAVSQTTSVSLGCQFTIPLDLINLLGHKFSIPSPVQTLKTIQENDQKKLIEDLTIERSEPTQLHVAPIQEEIPSDLPTEQQRTEIAIGNLKEWLSAAAQMQEVLGVKLKDRRVTIDSKKNPAVRDAIRRLFGKDSNTITYEMYKQVLKWRSELLTEGRDQTYGTKR